MNASEHKQKIESFTGLETWKTGHKLVIDIYHATDTFSSSEQFSLISQMRRCAVSITSNVAEGFSRRARKDKTQFYTVAVGPLAELQNQLVAALDVGYITETRNQEIDVQAERVHKIITGLIKSTRNTV